MSCGSKFVKRGYVSHMCFRCKNMKILFSNLCEECQGSGKCNFVEET